MAKATDTKAGFKQDKTTPQKPTIGKNYLLAIAVDEYEHFQKLSNCVKDANDIINVLQERYTFEDAHITKLFNPDATIKNIYAALRELQRKITENDNLLLLFSGHGFYDKDTRTGHLVPFGAEWDELYQYISNENLRSLIGAINSRHTFLIVDSCFSGSLIVGKNAGTKVLAERVEGLKSRWALAAGRIEEVEDGRRGDNSPFAKAILSYLRSNTEEKFPISDFINEVTKITVRNAGQTPIGGALFKADDLGGEFVFYLKTDPEETLWQKAKALDTAAAYDDYLDEYPNGRYAEDAHELLDASADREAWEYAKRLGTLPAIREYLRRYPQGRYKAEAEAEKNKQKTAYAAAPPPLVEEKIILPDPPKLIVPDNLILVEGGTFKMGSNDYDSEKPIHEVKLDSFYIGKYPVTFEEYDAFCAATKRDKPGDEKRGRARRPVINVSWYDALAYCNWLSEQQNLQQVYTINDKNIGINWRANGYRLPTEAEWEYAARGGKKSKGYKYAGSNDLDKVAWYSANAGSQTHPVGEKDENELGIHDMSGNVWEWCWDWYDAKYYEQFKNRGVENPRGPDNGDTRVVRGGSWYSDDYICRSTDRNGFDPDIRLFILGFRYSRAFVTL
ncbi:MAG: SUMF1/EgtB/PvdO family nonheme iron enzyme [Saprospiraceae bacterium]|nr:SUMF1/EgtB/PvdO family nonheme iron enzyme [Saprospiraceae bacterium]